MSVIIEVNVPFGTDVQDVNLFTNDVTQYVNKTIASKYAFTNGGNKYYVMIEIMEQL